MSTLPDFEGLAIFAKVAELRSFAGAARELSLSKATISKAVSRLEKRLGTRLFNRTSRRLLATEAGRALSLRASAILAAAEVAESEAQLRSSAPRGLVRLAVPMSFGVLHIAPLIPEFLKLYPEISIDLHLSDSQIDIIGDGFDAAIRVASLRDSSLVARKLCDMAVHLLVAPSYLKSRGRPKHPSQLADHACLSYAYFATPDTWRFRKSSGEVATVRPTGPLRVNNGDAMLPSLISGLGFGILPHFIANDALADGSLEVALPEWSLGNSAVNWILPPGRHRPKRVEALGDFLVERLGRLETTARRL